LKNNHLYNLSGSNGHSKPEFPLTFDLKVILENYYSEEQMQAHLRLIFSRLGIPNAEWRSRLSTGGKYISFTIEITLKDETIMKNLYSVLKTLPGVKLAL